MLLQKTSLLVDLPNQLVDFSHPSEASFIVKVRCLEQFSARFKSYTGLASPSGTADVVVLKVVPFNVGHSALPSAAVLDPSTLRSALVALVQSSVCLACRFLFFSSAVSSM